MKFYTYGKTNKPVILLIPGTCCHHTIFKEVIPLLKERCYVIVASFSGFDETVPDIYKDMDTETEAIEEYVTKHFSGHIEGCYGCSLGGSFAVYLVQRGKISIDHVIIGSSDMDEAHGFSAVFQSRLISGLMYKWMKKGDMPGWIKRINEKKIRNHPEEAEYRTKFMNMFLMPCLSGGTVKKESIYNQFYSDLVTVIDEGIDMEGTVIHIFYATKMGERYEKRYLKHFAHPDIRRHDMQHEELFACHPDEWTREVFDCMFSDKKQ